MAGNMRTAETSAWESNLLALSTSCRLGAAFRIPTMVKDCIEEKTYIESDRNGPAIVS